MPGCPFLETLLRRVFRIALRACGMTVGAAGFAEELSFVSSYNGLREWSPLHDGLVSGEGETRC
jgi:hypothetical protein